MASRVSNLGEYPHPFHVSETSDLDSSYHYAIYFDKEGVFSIISYVEYSNVGETEISRTAHDNLSKLIACSEEATTTHSGYRLSCQ